MATTEAVVASFWRQKTKKRGDYFALPFPACHHCKGHQRFLFSTPRLPTCDAHGSLVTMTHHSGTESTFQFGSRRYAIAFAEQNRAAGKNVLRTDLHPGVAYGPGGAIPMAAPAASTAIPVVGWVFIGLVAIVVLTCVVSMIAKGPDPHAYQQIHETPRQVTPVAIVPDAGAVPATHPAARHPRRPNGTQF